MRTKFLLFLAIFTMALGMHAKKYPQIKFEKTTIDFGTFSMDEPVQKCTFKFTNVGEANLSLLLFMLHAVAQWLTIPKTSLHQVPVAKSLSLTMVPIRCLGGSRKTFKFSLTVKRTWHVSLYKAT